ncbi:MAG: 2-amino-4-hydroxy-6-hydroxymethyldihydropteridine diphosphokinase [Burkholderiaceae bacterium]
MSTTAYVGLGSNLGDAAANVRAALARLTRLPNTRLQAQSSLFASAPIDAGGDDYVNAVAQLDTQLAAPQLLAELQAVEQEFGRQRPYRNAPRTLDLDLLLYGSERIASADLTVPHPRLTERAFALLPLLQLDPFIAIPGAGPAHAFAPQVAQQVIRRL